MTLPAPGTTHRERRIRTGANNTRTGVGPYSKLFRRGAAASLNGSSREGRFVRDVEHSLLSSLGTEPTVAQRMLAARLARVSLRIELFERDFLAGKTITNFDSKIYASLQNSFRLLLAEFESDRRQPATAAPTLADYLASKASPAADVTEPEPAA